MGPQARREMPRAPAQGKVDTKEFRRWEGVNVRDSRTGIGDTEFAWLENAITIGYGAVQILRRQGDSVASVSAGIATMFGVTLNGNPVMIAVSPDGSLRQITPSGTVTLIAAAGTVTINAHVSIWQSSPVLIVDPIKGYFSWDGTTFTAIDVTQTGSTLSVFQGRVWIARGRSLIWTSPNTFDDFNPANGSGNAVLTDEAFQGDIVTIVSALEQLWIVGESSIDALANVQSTGTPPLVTTSFSITNIVTNVGSPFRASVIGYFRALVFASAFGDYALSGVTPQKISDKLDSLPIGGTLGPVTDRPSAVAVVEDLLCVLFLVPYLGGQSVYGPPPVPLIVGFSQGKWFFATQGALRWITSLVVGGLPECWGTDGTHVYRLFGADCTVPVSYKIVSKLYDFGSAVTEKAMMKLGIELRSRELTGSGVPGGSPGCFSCIENNGCLP